MQINKDEIQSIIDIELKSAEKKYGKDFRSTVLKIVALERLVLEPAQVQTEKDRLIPLSKWNDYHPYPTVGALRQYYFYKDSNGFAEVCKNGGMNGGRILIKEKALFEWLENRQKKNNNIVSQINSK